MGKNLAEKVLDFLNKIDVEEIVESAGCEDFDGVATSPSYWYLGNSVVNTHGNRVRVSVGEFKRFDVLKQLEALGIYLTINKNNEIADKGLFSIRVIYANRPCIKGILFKSYDELSHLLNEYLIRFESILLKKAIVKKEGEPTDPFFSNDITVNMKRIPKNGRNDRIEKELVKYLTHFGFMQRYESILWR